MFEGGWRALLAVATLHRVCWVRAITYTAPPAPQWTAMGPDIQNPRKLDEIRNTGRVRPMSCLREAGEPCWLLPHSTGSVGSGPSHTQPLQPLSGQPWGLTFRITESWTKSEILAVRGQCRVRGRLESPAGCCHTPQGLLGQGHHIHSPSSPSVDSHGA